MAKVFVDGAAGTVGSALQPYLAQLSAEGKLTQIQLPEADRKDARCREDAYALADFVVLCLHDDDARTAAIRVSQVNPAARILDASAAHRCEAGWVYGLPELGQKEAIANAHRVANPGCFATACILSARPISRQLSSITMAFQGVTGYSAAGKKGAELAAPMLVQFGKAHRHLSEIARYAEISPILTTMIGPWERGMLVQTHVPYNALKIHRLLAEAYAGTKVRVVFDDALDYRVDPQACNGTNEVLICVSGQAFGGCSIAVVLDNLGKGAAGAAADNLRLMLGMQEVA